MARRRVSLVLRVAALEELCLLNNSLLPSITMPHKTSPNFQSKAERARQYLRTGGVLREDSDDELGLDDHPWEWIYSEETDNDEDAEPGQIIGARMGDFQCVVGDCCLLKAEGSTNEAWVGIICAFEEDDGDGEKGANFMWFSTEKEIRNKQKKRMDALPVGLSGAIEVMKDVDCEQE